MLTLVGEPINEEAWHWYKDVVGDGRCPVVDTWWQTGRSYNVKYLCEQYIYYKVVFTADTRRSPVEVKENQLIRYK